MVPEVMQPYVTLAEPVHHATQFQMMPTSWVKLLIAPNALGLDR